MSRIVRSSLGLGFVLVAVAILAPRAGPAPLADPIEGTWQWSGGQILVTKGGPGYIGKVTVAPAECGHPVGQQIWTIGGSAGGHYTGTHVGRHRSDCTPFPGLTATWDVTVSGATVAMKFCYYDPDIGQTVCTNPARIKGPAPTPTAGPSGAVDIEIAIDTTASMGSSINQAKADAHQLVRDVRKLVPNARFAVVQFRDRGDSPEYALVQPFTGNAALVDNAVDTLAPSGGGDYPEAYNLVYHSALDPANGFYSTSKKILVVIGDAEPHGARSAGYDQCKDTTGDPNSLSAATELGQLREAKWVVFMILQTSTASTTLQCYQQLAAAGAKGSAARKSGEANLVSVIEALIEKAVTPSTPATPGKADTQPPSVQAFPAAGKAFTSIALRYRVAENSGKSREQIMVYRGSSVLVNAMTKWGAVKAGGSTYHVNWYAKARPGLLRWCLRSFDPAGNRSAKSCASLRLTA